MLHDNIVFSTPDLDDLILGNPSIGGTVGLKTPTTPLSLCESISDYWNVDLADSFIAAEESDAGNVGVAEPRGDQSSPHLRPPSLSPLLGLFKSCPPTPSAVWEDFDGVTGSTGNHPVNDIVAPSEGCDCGDVEHDDLESSTEQDKMRELHLPEDAATWLTGYMDKPSWRCLWRRCEGGHKPGGDGCCKELRRHMERLRQFARSQMTVCRWATCQCSVNTSDSRLWRHVLEVHLKYKMKCPLCSTKFNRSDNFKRHLLTCRGVQEAADRGDAIDVNALKPTPLCQVDPGNAAVDADADATVMAAEPTMKASASTGRKRRASDEQELEEIHVDVSDDEGDADYEPRPKRRRVRNRKGGSAKARSHQSRSSKA